MIIQIPVHSIEELRKLDEKNIFNYSNKFINYLQSIRDNGIDENYFRLAFTNPDVIDKNLVEYKLSRIILDFLKSILSEYEFIFYVNLLRNNYYKISELKLFIESLAMCGVTFPFVWRVPPLLIVDVTNRCNLKCLHCYAGFYKEEPTLEMLYKLIGEAKRMGVVSIVFSGGEPIVRKDLFDLIKKAKQMHFDVKISTNATLITDGIAMKLKNAGLDKAMVSIDGMSKETHESLRGKGTFDRAIKGLWYLKNNGIDTVVEMVLNKFNMNEIIKLENIMYFYRLVRSPIFLYDFIPVGRGSLNKLLELTPDEKIRTFEKLFDLTKKIRSYGFNLPLMIYSPLATLYAYRKDYEEITAHQTNILAGMYSTMIFGRKGLHARWNSLLFGGCWAGRYYVGIASNGLLKPCPFAPLINCNVYKKSLNQCLSNPIIKLLKIRDLTEECVNCPFYLTCGGCRARTASKTNDFRQIDPACPVKNGLFDMSKIEVTPYGLVKNMLGEKVNEYFTTELRC